MPIIERPDNVSEFRSRSWTLSTYRALGHLVRYLQNQSRYSSTLQYVLRDLKTVVDVNTSPTLIGLTPEQHSPSETYTSGTCAQVYWDTERRTYGSGGLEDLELGECDDTHECEYTRSSIPGHGLTR